MNQAGKPQPTIAEIERWPAIRHDRAIEGLSSLAGGFWSSAYVYRVSGVEFVLRISDMHKGFAIDAAAMRFAGPGLPVPLIVEPGRHRSRRLSRHDRAWERLHSSSATTWHGSVSFHQEKGAASARARSRERCQARGRAPLRLAARRTIH